MFASLTSYLNAIAIYSAADPDKVSTIRITGLIFMGFGIAYLVYRWFRDR